MTTILVRSCGSSRERRSRLQLRSYSSWAGRSRMRGWRQSVRWHGSGCRSYRGGGPRPWEWAAGPVRRGLGREIENVVGAEERFCAAAVGRVGMVDVACLLFIKRAETVTFFHRIVLDFVVVKHLSRGHFVPGERDVEVAVEVGAEG